MQCYDGALISKITASNEYFKARQERMININTHFYSLNFTYKTGKLKTVSSKHTI